ncbi:MAG: hypothetical protein JXR84_22540, partial [Anaerolineae bacterium]|nr:hypothetical protein [Anaerolineae bacterium]
MDFNEAQQRFQSLEDRRHQRTITPEQYRAELNLLRVTDAWGRLWMPQERTGQWFVYENGQWRAAQPPIQPPPPPPPAPVGPQPRQKGPQPVRPQLRSAMRPQPVAQTEKGGGCGKVVLYLVLWAV